MLLWKHRKFLLSAQVGRADGFQKLLKIHELRSVGGQEQGFTAMTAGIPQLTWNSMLHG